MKPSYLTLKNNHYSGKSGDPSFLSGDDLYAEIGYDLNAMIADPGYGESYQNTCAARMSLALLKSGVAFTGRLKVKTGTYKGQKIEMGAIRLADELKRIWGKPEVFVRDNKAENKLLGRKGVVFFHTITGYGGGHIDLLEPSEPLAPAHDPTSTECHTKCYFTCREVWFWELE